MHLFAQRGFEATTIRDVAAQAGVSSSLVVHHFKTKAQLKAATDARLITVLTEMLAELPTCEAADVGQTAASMTEQLRDEPDLMAYLRRMLVDGGQAAAGLFMGLVDATEHELAAQETAGVVLPAADARTRAVFLIVNDLGAIILQALIENAIGIDPLSPDGMRQWGAVVMDVYTRGVYAAAPDVTPPDATAAKTDRQGS